MQTTQILLTVFVSTLVSGAGCDPDEGRWFGDDDVEFRPIGGVWLNTSSIGPLTLTQLDLDGDALDGMSLTDVLVPRPGDQWLRLDRIDIIGGKIRGRKGGTFYEHQALVGSRWLLSPTQGQPVEMWLAGYTVVSGVETRYNFQTLNAGGSVVSVCDPDAEGSTAAIPVKDITVDRATGVMAARSRTMYLACVSGAVGKAFTWGYGPGDLASFEAAVRMVRADYCHDGTSWTTEGTSVQVRDSADINTFEDANYPTEAVWTATGLACLTQPRWTVFQPAQVVCGGVTVPSCPANVGMSTYPSTLFWTKLGG